MNESCYFTPADSAHRTAVLDNLQKRYKFINVFSIGKSRCSREIQAVSLGNTKNKVLFCGGVHGSEWLTSSLMLLFLRKLCGAADNQRRISNYSASFLLKYKGVTIIPCLNPDGTEIAINGPKAAGEFSKKVSEQIKKGIWQANAAGVDLNHNFPAGWEELKALEIKSGITAPANTRYGGESPGSEPETSAIMQFCREQHFRHALAFHSQGEEIYWNYGKHTPKYAYKIGKALEKVSGYKLSAPEGLAVGGGFKDWFIEEFHRPAFTIEIGKGKNPLPVEKLPEIYARLEEMLIMSILL